MSLAYFPDFYRINDSSKLVFRIQQLPAAFSSLSTWFVGQDSLDNKNNVPFPFLSFKNISFPQIKNLFLHFSIKRHHVSFGKHKCLQIEFKKRKTIILFWVNR